MSESVVRVLLLGDAGSGQSKFIEKFLHRYPTSKMNRKATYEIYIYEGADHTIYLYNITDVEKCCMHDKVDMIILAHNSDEPETFRSLQEKWIPHITKVSRIAAEHNLVMDNSSNQQVAPTENSRTSVSEQLEEQLSNLFGPLWCTAYVFDYKLVFSMLKHILVKESTQTQSASDEFGSNASPKNQHNLNGGSPFEIVPEGCPEVELRKGEWKVILLTEDDCPTVELNINSGSTVQLGPNECYEGVVNPNEDSIIKLSITSRSTVDSSPNECFTALSPMEYVIVESIPKDFSASEMSPKKLDTSELTPSDCSTVELNPSMRDEVKSSPPSDCSTVEMTPKNYSAVEFSSNKLDALELSPSDCSTEELNQWKHDDVECTPSDFATVKLSPNKSPATNPDEGFERSTGKYSPDQFSADGGSSTHSPRTSPDIWSPVISSPDGEFSPADSSSDENFQDELTSDKLSPNDCSTTSSINIPQQCPLNYRPNKCSGASRIQKCAAIISSRLQLISNKFGALGSRSSDCSTEKLNQRKLNEVKSIPSDCSTIQFSPNKCSTAETNSDEGFALYRSPGKHSPVEFGSGECTPERQDTPVECRSAISTPEATFSSDNFSSDDNI